MIGLIIHGTVAVKEALTPVDGKPGDIPFFVVHKQMVVPIKTIDQKAVLTLHRANGGSRPSTL